MLTASQLGHYANILCWGLRTARKEKFRPGDTVLVRFDAAALPLAEKVYADLLALRLRPVIQLLETPPMEKAYYESAGEDLLGRLVPGSTELTSALNGLVHISAPASLTHLRGANAGRIGRSLKAKKILMDIRRRREEAGKLGWTLCTFPTEALAAQAGLSLAVYERAVIRACLLDTPHPLAAWQVIYKKAGAVKRWLNGLPVTRLRVESVSTDLSISPGDKRQWIGVTGRNIPSFEIFTSPDWRGTEGIYGADQPSFRSGNRVAGVKLEFLKGKVIRAAARQGVKFLRKMVGLDANSCKIGEFSLTDRRFSRIDRFMADTLYDENYGGRFGNCHLALGSSYSAAFDGDPVRLTADRKLSLGFNDSALHWDLVNTEKKRVTAELRGGGSLVIYENGEFTGP